MTPGGDPVATPSCPPLFSAGVPVKVTNTRNGVTHHSALELFVYLNDIA